MLQIWAASKKSGCSALVYSRVICRPVAAFLQAQHWRRRFGESLDSRRVCVKCLPTFHMSLDDQWHERSCFQVGFNTEDTTMNVMPSQRVSVRLRFAWLSLGVPSWFPTPAAAPVTFKISGGNLLMMLTDGGMQCLAILGSDLNRAIRWKTWNWEHLPVILVN